MVRDVDALPDFRIPDVPYGWDARHMSKYGYTIPYHLRIDRQEPVDPFQKKVYRVPIVVIDLDTDERYDFQSVAEAIAELKVSARLGVVARMVGLYRDRYLCYHLSSEDKVTPDKLQYFRELVEIKGAFGK